MPKKWQKFAKNMKIWKNYRWQVYDLVLSRPAIIPLSKMGFLSLIAIVICSHVMAQNLKKVAKNCKFLYIWAFWANLVKSTSVDPKYPTLANQFWIRQSLILPRVQPLGHGGRGRVLKHPVFLSMLWTIFICFSIMYLLSSITSISSF